jgi:hypothetical protein
MKKRICLPSFKAHLTYSCLFPSISKAMNSIANTVQSNVSLQSQYIVQRPIRLAYWFRIRALATIISIDLHDYFLSACFEKILQIFINYQ